MALGLLTAWFVDDRLRCAARHDRGNDLIGVWVFAALLLLLPVADDERELLRGPRRRSRGRRRWARSSRRSGRNEPIRQARRPTIRPIGVPGAPAPGGAATSSPPEVIASHRSQRSSSDTASAHVTHGSTHSRLRRVPPAIGGSAAPSRSSTPSIAGTAADVELGGHAAGERQLVQVPEQPEAGHVGHRARARRESARGRVAVERRHHAPRSRA